MSLINNPPIDNATPQQIAARKIRGAASQMLANYLIAFRLVWEDPHPDQVVAAMGTDAVHLFQLSASVAALLVQAGATNIPTTMPAGWNFQPNADGSVTLTKTV